MISLSRTILAACLITVALCSGAGAFLLFAKATRIETVFDNSNQPWPLVAPAQVNAENFDINGFVGSLNANCPATTYRSDSGGGNLKPIGTATGPTGGVLFRIGCWVNGSSYGFMITNPTTATLAITAALAQSDLTPGAVSVSMDGAAVANIPIPNTGSYDVFATSASPGFSVPAGQHILKFQCANTSSGACGDFAWFQGNPSGGGGQTVAAVTLTNGPPNIPTAAPGSCDATHCTLIEAGVANEPVSDVYADLTPISSNYSGSFTVSDTTNFAISTSPDGAGRQVGHITTKLALAAGDYPISVCAGTTCQPTMVHAVSGTAVGCPGGASSTTVQNAANTAGAGATLLFPACTYTWTAEVTPPANQKWVGIYGQTIFDAGGNEPSGNIMVSGFPGTGVMLANLTFQNLGTNFSNPYGCTPGGSLDCPHRDWFIQTNDGWVVRTNQMLNSVFSAMTNQDSSATTQTVVNNIIRHTGADGIGATVNNGSTFNIVGNDISDINYGSINVCDGGGSKWLGNNSVINYTNNYFHNNKAPTFWQDSYNGGTFTFTGNTIYTSGAGGGAPGAIMFEATGMSGATISFNDFVDNGNGTDSPTGNDPVCGGEGVPATAIDFQSAQNGSVHDNNVSSRVGSGPNGSWAGGTINFVEECIPNPIPTPNQNVAIHDNTITFFAAAPGGSMAETFGTTGGSCVGDHSNTGLTADRDAFHYVYSGASANDAHFEWTPNWNPNNLVNLAGMKSIGQETNAPAIDFTDASTTGCTHVACSGSGVGAGGVPLAPTGPAAPAGAIAAFGPNPTLVFNLDFTQPSTLPASWLGCQPWDGQKHIFYQSLAQSAVQSPPSMQCPFLTTDNLPNGDGSSVLDVPWKSTDTSSGSYPFHINQLQTIDGNNPPTFPSAFPNNYYVQYIFRIQPQPDQAIQPGNWTATWELFDNTGSGLDAIENDTMEDIQVFGFGGAATTVHNWASPGQDASQYYNTGNGNYPARGYHTWEERRTSDGSSDIAFCVYVDGSQKGCVRLLQFSSAFPLDFSKKVEFLLWNGGACASGPSTDTSCFQQSGTWRVDMLFKAIRVWSCAAWQTTNCNVGVITSNP